MICSELGAVNYRKDTTKGYKANQTVSNSSSPRSPCGPLRHPLVTADRGVPIVGHSDVVPVWRHQVFRGRQGVRRHLTSDFRSVERSVCICRAWCARTSWLSRTTCWPNNDALRLASILLRFMMMMMCNDLMCTKKLATEASLALHTMPELKQDTFEKTKKTAAICED